MQKHTLQTVNCSFNFLLLYRVVADQQRRLPPGAPEHVHVGAPPDSTSHSAGARPHHLNTQHILRLISISYNHAHNSPTYASYVYAYMAVHHLQGTRKAIVRI